MQYLFVHSFIGTLSRKVQPTAASNISSQRQHLAADAAAKHRPQQPEQAINRHHYLFTMC